MNKKYHLLYKTTNIETNKYYIGMHSTDNIDDEYLGSGHRLRLSISKYGKNKHHREVLEFFESRTLLASREKEVINDELLLDPLCMNLRRGGEGGCLPGEGNPFFGRKHSDEAKMKISLAGTKLIHTPEAKAKIAKAGKGRVCHDETRRKRSIACKGKQQKHSTETVAKREAAKCRAILINDILYPSITQAAALLELGRNKIYQMLKSNKAHYWKP